MLHGSCAQPCSPYRRSGRHLPAARATLPSAACGKSCLSTLRPGPSGSCRQPRLLRQACQQRLLPQACQHISNRVTGQEAGAAAPGSGTPPAVGAAAGAARPLAVASAPVVAAAAAAAAAAATPEPAAPAPADAAHGTPAAVLPALQGAPPLPQLLLAGLPHLMEGYSQGALGGGAVVGEEVQQALAASLLPAPGDNRSQSWVGDDGSLWWAPLKPLSMLLQRWAPRVDLPTHRNTWAGLAPGEYWRETVTVLVPRGPQHGGKQQQQQQQEEEEEVPCAVHDMHGDWQVAASTTGALSVFKQDMTSPHLNIKRRPLIYQLKPLAADLFVLRAHYSQGALRVYCVPACFLQPPGTPPLLEQRLAPQLRDLAAGVQLQHRLAGSAEPGTRAIVHNGVAWWYPCPVLSSKVNPRGNMSLPGTLWQCLAHEGCSSVVVTLHVMGPATAAAAARSSLSLTGCRDEDALHTQRQHAAAVDCGVSWAVLQEEAGMQVRRRRYIEHFTLTSAPIWRRVLGSWGGWHLFKAQAVAPNIIRLYLLPPEAFNLVTRQQPCAAAAGLLASAAATTAAAEQAAGKPGAEAAAMAAVPVMAAAAPMPEPVASAPADATHGALAAMFPVLQGAPPLLQLLLAGLPHLMEGYSQGALGGGAVVEEEVQQALAASLLPPPSDVCSQGWVLDDGSLWWVPLKPLSLFLNDHGIHLYRGSWAGLVPGQSWWGTVTVLAPCGPHMGDPLQRQQQQQQQQQQQVPWAGHDMPGDWWVAASASGMIRWRTLRSRPATFVVSSPLLRLLEPLAADHFLLRAQHSQDELLLYCVPACFLQPPGAPPLLEQQLAPQLRDLAARVPLVQRLAGTTETGTRPVMQHHTGVAWWYPCPLLRSKVDTRGQTTVPGTLWQCLAPEGSSSVLVTLQVMGPAGAALWLLPSRMPHQEEHVPNPQLQHLSALKPAAAFSQASSCVSWVLLQEATGVKLVKRVIYRTIRLAKLSSVVETWGGWHLFKAQAVPPSTIRLYLLPPGAFTLVTRDGGSSGSDAGAAGAG